MSTRFCLFRFGRSIVATLAIICIAVPQVSGQPEECGTRIPPGTSLQEAMPPGIRDFDGPNTVSTLRVAVHIVRYSDLSGGIGNSEIAAAFQVLNSAFSGTQMQFAEFTRDYIDDDRYAVIESDAEADQLRLMNSIAATVNLYFVPVSLLWEGLSSFTFDNVQGIIIVNAAATSSTTPHEFGHYFNLFHTHERHFNPSNVNYENISRSGTCANCTVAGDLLCDTPADYGLYDEVMRVFNVNEQCEFSPIKPPPYDDCGARNWNPSTTNLMSYSRPACRNSFTSQQVQKMNYTLQNSRSELFNAVVRMTNLIGTQNAGGTLHLDAQHVASGFYGHAPENTTHKIGTDNERFVGHGVPEARHKHNNFFISLHMTTSLVGT